MPGSKERQRRRAREHFERQQQQRIARQRKIRRWSLTGLVIVLVAGLATGLTLSFATGSPAKHAKKKASASASPSASASASATPAAAAAAEPAHHCTYTPASTGGNAHKASLPPATPDYKAAYAATINTNLGKIGISLENSKATCTVNSFVHLAETGFWDNTQCHRISDGDGLYMLQCGDPTAKADMTLSCSTTQGSGGPGYQFSDENLTGATYPAGTLAMANSGEPGTNGSQFFLVFKNTNLPPSYTPFGTITSGLDILQNVSKAGTSCTYSGVGGGVPKEKVIIKSVSISKT